MLIETNDYLRTDPNLLLSDDAGQGKNWLAIFALSTKHRTMLSVEDRAVEGSEEERDRAEELTVNRDPHLVEAKNNTESDDQKIGSEAGADWRSFLQYLKPNEYIQRRKHMFIGVE